MLLLDTYVKTSQRIIGNPSSLHDLGSQANRLLQQARKQIAELIDVSANEIYFRHKNRGLSVDKPLFSDCLINLE